MTGDIFCCLFAVLIIRNFDMGKDKVKFHSTLTAEAISGWSVT